MQFQLTKEFLDELLFAIEEGNDNWIKHHLGELHHADIADIFHKLSPKQSAYIFRLLHEGKAADTLLELSEDVREKVLGTLSPQQIAEIVIENIDSDDAADVIGELSEDKKEEVISHIEDVNQASDIIDLLTYEEDTAGALMGKELIKVNENWTVATSIRQMRKQAEDLGNFYTIYVVDDKDVLKGRLSLKKLLFSSTSSLTKIKELYDRDIRQVTTDEKSEEVVKIIEKYDLVALPVVDEQMRLIGRITVDDVVDVMKEEARKDYHMASGISEKVEFGSSVWRLSRARLPWLLVGLLGGVLGAQVIATYEDQLKINPFIAFFIPLIAAMGGNAGVQSSAIVVQGLANSTLDFGTTFSKVLKESAVGLINGLICSLIIFLYILILRDDILLGMTVGISLLSVITFATVFGTFIPLLLFSNKIDPALATGPFITTMNDVLGLFIYFMIGRLMYSL